MNENLVPVFGTIHTPDDYDRLIPVMTMEDEFMKSRMELTRQILAGCDKDVFTMVLSMASVHPAFIRLSEISASIIMQQDRCRLISSDGMRRRCFPLCSALPMCCACWQRKAYIEVGLDSVYYASLGGEYEFFTDEEFAKWIKPFDIQVMKAIKEAGGYCFPAHL